MPANHNPGPASSSGVPPVSLFCAFEPKEIPATQKKKTIKLSVPGRLFLPSIPDKIFRKKNLSFRNSERWAN
jgi:hypothetical protein